VILFFGGAIAWHFWWLFRSRDRRGPAAALCVVLFLFTVFLLNGGKTLERFQGTEELSPGNGRVQIFRDAFHLSQKSPLLGVGLGNFRPLFSSARNYSMSISEAVHPESDWLWGAVELGWIAPALALLAILWWLGQCFPFAAGTGSTLRFAAMICGIAFAAHGLVDVSAHRLGTLWPALFLGSLALYPKRDIETSKVVPGVYRAIGVVLIALSICWITSVSGVSKFPTTARIMRLERDSEQALSRGDYERALAQSNEGIRVAPLDWLLYYSRGVAEAALYRPRPDALRDFAVARHLFANWPDLYLREGNVWIDLGEPELAFAIWKEGMQKLGENAFILYEGISHVVGNDPALRDQWFDLAGDDPRCLVTALSKATPAEFVLQPAFERQPRVERLFLRSIARSFSDVVPVRRRTLAHRNDRPESLLATSRVARNFPRLRQPPRLPQGLRRTRSLWVPRPAPRRQPGRCTVVRGTFPKQWRPRSRRSSTGGGAMARRPR
jgi:hypothetical protein